LRLAWEQVWLPRLVGEQAVSVHHGPHYTMPERSPVPSVVTVHDMSFFEQPRWHERSKVVLFRRAIRVAAKRAAAVVCPSEVTAGQLRRWCRVEAPVFVAHHGVDTARFRPDPPDPDVDVAALTRLDVRLVDGSPFVVFVGTIEPRKDVPTLVAAFSRVATSHPEVRLVLAGGAGWGSASAAVERAVAVSGFASRVIRTGYVADAAVPALLRSAAAAVYPAVYEGFGLPALEALACGTPLITTSGTAMEEVTGDAAVLVPPGDVEAMAEAIEARLDGSEVGEAVTRDRERRGLAIVAAHTWADSAARHMEAYRAAVAGRGAGGDAGGGTQPVG
jgi:glycosyltransferase involved in cell wall biosynthesis